MITKKLETRLIELCSTVGLKQKHAAAVLKGAKVLAYGTNKNKTHTANLAWGKNPAAIFIHAEVDAIVRAINLYGEEAVKGCTLVVCRLSKNQQLANSCPCAGCAKAIKELDLKVLYSINGGWAIGP